VVHILVNNSYRIREGIKAKELKYIINMLLDDCIDKISNEAYVVFDDTLKILYGFDDTIKYDQVFIIRRDDLYGVFNTAEKPLIKKKKMMAKRLLDYCLDCLIA